MILPLNLGKQKKQVTVQGNVLIYQDFKKPVNFLEDDKYIYFRKITTIY